MEDVTQDPLYQRLFRVFCWLSEGEIGLSSARATFLIEETRRLSGHPSTSRRLAFNGETVSFREFLGLLENQFSNRKDLEAASHAVFDRYVDQILLKELPTQFKRLVLFALRFHRSVNAVQGVTLYRRNQTARSCRPWRKTDAWQTGNYCIGPGCIQISSLKGNRLRPKVKMPIDGSTDMKIFRSETDRNVCVISNGKQFLELATIDSFSTNLLEQALRTGSTSSSRETLLVADRRRAAKFHGREAETEERVRLEKEKAKLERDLEEERQALRDEEIVRGLATRMLEEERLKSENIERVLQELQQKFQQRGARQDSYPEPSSLEKSLDFEDALEADEGQYVQSGESEVWQKEDFLILSTQSI